MVAAPIILVVIVGYLVVLVTVGWRADRARDARGERRLQPLFYGLSLATLCSAWTYFGGVGDASNGSWLFVANALGPILAVTLGYPVWRRIAELSKQENVGSLADFLAARYGKSRRLGILTACIASLGALPYIALQLTVLMRVWAFAKGTAVPGAGGALVLVLLLAGIAILFGARRPSLTQHNRGFVAMIAIESGVKLAGLLGVAGLGIAIFARAPAGLMLAIRAVPPLPAGHALAFLTLVLLCTMTAFTLPRQFHLGFVTLERLRDMRGAIWVVPAYFALWVVATLVIAVTIRAGFGAPGVDPHLEVLAVPMRHGEPVLAMLALIGGLSAGAAMVIVEATAISAMVSNEIVLPLFAGWMRRGSTGADLGRAILLVRRGTILGIALLAWFYFLGVSGVEGTMQLGMTALAAYAQLCPALLGGIYWRRGHARGAIAGIGAGMIVWALTLAGPDLLLARGGGDAAINGLWPVTGWMPYGAVLASLMLNTGLFVVVSLRSPPRLIDTIQANSFVASAPPVSVAQSQRINATVGDLRRLLGQFLGAGEADKALLSLRIGARAGTGALSDAQSITPNLARAAERLLAGVIGAPSARNVVAIALAAASQDAGEISRILDEAGHAVHFSRELLQTTLDSLPQGVSVVDSELRMVAWNGRFLQLAELSIAEIHVGRPLGELLGEVAGEVSGAIAGRDGARVDAGLRRRIAARLADLAHHKSFEDEIRTLDGRSLRLTGLPLAGGDYLTMLADITDLRAAERVLARSNEELEARVRERTRALVEANEALAAAKQQAELATGAQKRFVAAASHDLVQPLHAARLFIGNALVGAEDPTLTALLARADQAVEGAHRLLRALLNLAQLETGALRPKLAAVDVGGVLASLAEDFAAEAEARGLTLIALPTRAWVLSDGDLLRAMLQNLVINALRYTPRGRVVMAARRAGGAVRLEVRDSGVGIAAEQLPTAFGEFSRLSEGAAMAEGAGLGLAIVARIAQVLDHPLAVRSRSGAGSVFSVTVPRAAPAPLPMRIAQRAIDLGGLRVLCVDDEADVLAGTAALITRWGGRVTAFASAAEVPSQDAWDVAIADYHLGDAAGSDGLALLRALAGRARSRLLITATCHDGWAEALAREGIGLFAKPVAPLALRALLAEAARVDHAAGGGLSRASASS